ncbi:SLOG family protein [Streptococcus didelphis]|uniref:SLOG family protein n=1 Tax=Streptococcus didelphis TaxID=102886 RepID=UPI0003631544|nr:SLOG family protein [Streptococcus didelphis]WMB29282.1 SLOG family protein [Streptococcus didelphis]
MTAILVMGYKSFEIGIFDDKDYRIAIIQKAIKKDFISYIEEGVDWFIFTGNLGFEYWAFQVARDLKKDYPIEIATIFPFESHSAKWNEANLKKLQEFKASDFVKYCFKEYEKPWQFTVINQFLIENTDGAYLFYDNENETNLKYLITKMKEKNEYGLHFLTFESLNDILDEER